MTHRIATVVGLCALVACGAVESPNGTAPRSTVQTALVPGALIEAGVQYQVSFRARAGDLVWSPSATLTTSDTTVARVIQTDNYWTVTGRAAGKVTIVATDTGVSESYPITVYSNVDLPVRATRIERLREFGCVIQPSGRAACWGSNTSVQLGRRTPSICTGAAHQNCAPGGTGQPVAVRGALAFTSIRGDDGACTVPYIYPLGNSLCGGVCGLTTGGEVRCWGGLDTTSTPPNMFPGHVFISMSMSNTGGRHVCAVTSDDAVMCRTSTGEVPIDAGKGYVAVTVGPQHSCALTASGDAWCWGSNASGQFGNGAKSSTVTTAPTRTPSAASFTSLAAGTGLTCALASDGAVYCWGNDILTPTAAPGGRAFTSIDLRGATLCGVATSGQAYCWGALTETPQPVAAPEAFQSVSVGSAFVQCGVSVTNRAYCWSETRQAALVEWQP